MQGDRLAERVATLEAEVRGLTRRSNELESELRGPGGIRSRVHKIEGNDAAAELAQQRLDLYRQEQRSAGAYFDRRATLVLAAIVALANGLFYAIERLT